MDLNEIVVFAKVVEAGSFTAGARLLDMPKSTVSRRVSSLEDRLGVRLLHRTTRKLNLTDVGAAYYQRCARILAELEEAELAASSTQAEPRGRLRVTAPVEFVFLGEMVAGFLGRYPEMEVEVELSGRLVDLIEEGFDLALRAGQLPDSALIARKLGTVQSEVVCAPSYLEHHPTPIRPTDLSSGHECILFGAAQRGGSWQLGDAPVPVSGRLRTNDIALARSAAVAGLGIALLPDPMCRGHMVSGQLVELLEEWLPPPVPVYAVYPSSRYLSPKIHAFVELVAERLDTMLVP